MDNQVSNKLVKLQEQYNVNIVINGQQTTLLVESKLEEAVIIAFDRVNAELGNFKNISSDIMKKFGKHGEGEIIKAMNNGGHGFYGRTRNNMSIQEISYWIVKYFEYDNYNYDINGRRFFK